MSTNKIIRGIINLILSAVIIFVGCTALLYVTYAMLEQVVSGTPFSNSMGYLRALAPDGVLKALGNQILTHIPFADFLNAVFITNVTPDMFSLFTSFVTACFAGLIFFLLTRINLIFSRIISSRVLFNSITAVLTVASICISLVATTWITHTYSGETLIALLCGLIAVSLIAHTLLFVIWYGGFKFGRVLTHTLIDTFSGTINNIFLWGCSYVFMNVLPGMGIGEDYVLIYSIVGGLILLGLFTYVMNLITSYLWAVTRR